MSMRIEIPNDIDGFVLLQCPNCDNYFKLIPSDMQDDRVLEIHCPYCGLVGESYFTEEIVSLSEVMAKNHVMNEIFNTFKNIEKEHQYGLVTMKIRRTQMEEYESPILNISDILIRNKYDCCNMEAKIKPMMKMAGTYCPFCGVKDFGIN